jgi:hypothetical protein
MTFEPQFPHDDFERDFLAALPRTSPDPYGEDRLVALLRQNGHLPGRRAFGVVLLRLAAAAVLFVSGVWAGGYYARRNSLEDMLHREHMSLSDRVLLAQRAGSAYVQATQQLAIAGARDSRAMEVVTQTLVGAAQAAARANLDNGLSTRLASLLSSRSAASPAPSPTIIWY